MKNVSSLFFALLISTSLYAMEQNSTSDNKPDIISLKISVVRKWEPFHKSTISTFDLSLSQETSISTLLDTLTEKGYIGQLSADIKQGKKYTTSILNKVVHDQKKYTI